MPSVATRTATRSAAASSSRSPATFASRRRTPSSRCPRPRSAIIPGYGGTQRLPRIVGEARALEMILTAKTVDAQTALAWGLASRVVEGDPLAAGIAFAREFSGYSLPALGFAREAVQRALDTPVHEGLRIEADLSTLAFQTADAAEGMAAFLAKRKPAFKDR